MEITEIAGYRVLRQLGAGGMGQVYLVEHPRLPRRDALKLLDAGVSRNDDFQARFQREADLLAQLSHPNIVTLHDRGEHQGRLWITMEYVEGIDADHLLSSRGPMPFPLAHSLISGAGAALDYAWRKHRITHRDVKPANLFLVEGDPRDVAGDVHGLVGDEHLERRRAVEDREVRGRDGAPALEAGPARMGAAHRVVVHPQVGQPVEITRLERGVVGVDDRRDQGFVVYLRSVGAVDRATVAARRPRWRRRWIDPTATTPRGAGRETLMIRST